LPPLRCCRAETTAAKLKESCRRHRHHDSVLLPARCRQAAAAAAKLRCATIT
jgi:hypothetical protein